MKNKFILKQFAHHFKNYKNLLNCNRNERKKKDNLLQKTDACSNSFNILCSKSKLLRDKNSEKNSQKNLIDSNNLSISNKLTVLPKLPSIIKSQAIPIINDSSSSSISKILNVMKKSKMLKLNNKKQIQKLLDNHINYNNKNSERIFVNKSSTNVKNQHNELNYKLNPKLDQKLDKSKLFKKLKIMKRSEIKASRLSDHNQNVS